MKIKKIVAAVAAAAMAVSMMAVNVFAGTVQFGDYPGDWAASTTIPKAEFAAIGGDVKVTLDLEQKAPLVGDINALLKPMDACGDWSQLTWTGLTSDTAYAKGDGFIVVPAGTTTVEFVVPESIWSKFVDWDGGESEAAGLAFQVSHVYIKSATLSAGSAQGEFKQVSEEESKDLMVNGAPAAEATTAPATGNAPVAAIAVVMALAGAAAVATKKN